MAHNNLNNARKCSNDEFYTRLPDIEKELKHYKDVFRDKVVYCNCDDPRKSAFWEYFHINFSRLGLKRLIATYYVEQLFKWDICAEKPCVAIYDGGNDDDISICTINSLKGDGDFRSVECKKFLDESDIVVTNPPWSLFREFVTYIVDNDKKFILLGNMNALHCTNIFPLICSNKLRVGYTNFNTGIYFKVPNDFEYAPTYKNLRIKDNEAVCRVPGCCWYTNFDTDKTGDYIVPLKSYSDMKYETYDELPNVIKVDKIADIPNDYYGFMAVPITFLNKYNTDDWEIVDALDRYTVMDYFKINDDVQKRHSHCCAVNGVNTYARIIVRRKNKER